MLLHRMSKRTEMVRVRVSPEEKAELEQRAGSQGLSAYVRQQLALSVPVGPNGTDSNGQDRAALAVSMPAKTWTGRVRQLCMQGVPRMAAERVADQEFRDR